MQSHSQISLKKWFLYALICSVAVSALLGMLAILIGDFGEIEVRVLLTSLTISGASLCGLSSGAALEAKRARGLPVCGIGLAVVAAVIVIFGIWTEVQSDEFWKTTLTIAVFAAACSHMALLLLARLAPRYAWSLWAATAAVFGVAVIVTVMMWAEVHEETMFRFLGVAAILDGAITILIPIFHRLSRGDVEIPASVADAPTLSEIDREISQLRSRLEDLEQLRVKVTSSWWEPNCCHGQGNPDTILLQNATGLSSGL